MNATSFLALDVDVESKLELSTLILALDSSVFSVAADFCDGVYRQPSNFGMALLLLR